MNLLTLHGISNKILWSQESELTGTDAYRTYVLCRPISYLYLLYILRISYIISRSFKHESIARTSVRDATVRYWLPLRDFTWFFSVLRVNSWIILYNRQRMLPNRVAIQWNCNCCHVITALTWHFTVRCVPGGTRIAERPGLHFATDKQSWRYSSTYRRDGKTKKKDVSSYWVTLRKGKNADTGHWKRKH